MFKLLITDINSERMAGNMKEEILEEEFKIKEESFFIKEEVFPPSTVEDICTVYVQEEDVKMENTEFIGNYINNADYFYQYSTWR